MRCRMLWVTIVSPLSPCPQILWMEPKVMIKLVQTATIALLGIGIIVVAANLFGTYIRQQAIDKCLVAGRDQFTRDGHTLTGPDGYWYKFCLDEKGIK